jgi:hypothetical protein
MVWEFDTGVAGFGVERYPAQNDRAARILVDLGTINLHSQPSMLSPFGCRSMTAIASIISRARSA